ncbi:MAG: DUF885 family protein [Ignavibacteria bacterium]|nr:DUF885 family protein [Ignavibacteria bacterium]
MRGIIERFSADLESLDRFYTVPSSSTRNARIKQFYTDWVLTLGTLEFDSLSQEDRVDYILFKNYLNRALRRLDLEAKSLAEQVPIIPFAQTISDLEDARRRMEWIDPFKAADILTAVNKRVTETRKAVEAGLTSDSKAAGIKVKKVIANRAVFTLSNVRSSLKRWYDFYNGYDPIFSWWMSEPYKAVDQALKNYAEFLRERVVGVKADDDTTVIGNPIGREALLIELEYEMIPYTPEELIAIANKEFAWCESEMKRASRELGYGDDWHKALEYVKSQHVEPGKQPELIRQLALEAINFLDQHDLVTVPQLARDTWRMEMLSPEQQQQSPFFLGGETILVSFPTNTMGHEEKMMSMRGNNRNFARATVLHELIPGHHLQGFMNARYRTYRGLFSTPFWTEGWAFYWETLFWDMKFPQSAENKIGMLFWRMHRCARIIFSLSFHLEKMTPQECINFLVERVGHERANATAEVRRSFSGGYGPLYQCAYMLGALQFRSLHHDLVETGKMTNRAFHDAILKENNIPVEMVRAGLTNQKLDHDFSSHWKFYNVNPPER